MIDFVRNPWLDLPSKPPFILPSDADGIRALERWCERNGPKASRLHLPQTQLYPDPFIGRPDAPVVIVMANPGYTDDAKAAGWHGCTGSDDRWHAASEIMRACYQANFQHEALPFPMFFLDPRLIGSPGATYFRSLFFKPLRMRFDDETLAHAITTVEFYPYHSRKFRWSRKFAVPSQAYSHQLVREAVRRGATLVVMRCRALLERELPELRGLDYIAAASINPAVSPGNLVSRKSGVKDGFDRLIAAIASVR